nr:unnamed protein product [Callosobruchus analis]
MPLSEYY